MAPNVVSQLSNITVQKTMPRKNNASLAFPNTVVFWRTILTTAPQVMKTEHVPRAYSFVDAIMLTRVMPTDSAF